MLSDPHQSKEHWEKVYSKTSNDKRGWYQKTPVISLEFFELTGAHTGRKILDVGGGTSHLAENIDVNQNELTILDISEAALSELKTSLKERASHIQFISGDILNIELKHQYDIWHDRAVFHFFIEQIDQNAYVSQLNRYLVPGGWLIMATFAEDGPE
ncbi:MAG: class I SAM-dependent methyltransferase, partial [Spirochaetia bacterium]|nr:class I SAM-dependent methyltransferase [Spirochaetia bacterium]